MNKILTFIFLFFFLNSFGQKNMYLKIVGENEKQTKIIDSIGYGKSFSNAKDVVDESKLFSEKLSKLGFLEQELLETKKENDSTFKYVYTIGAKTNFIHIYIGRNLESENWNLYEAKNDTLKLPFSESEAFLNATLKKLEAKGFSMAKVKLVNIKKHNGYITADLNVTSDKKRQLNDIVFNGYDKFPIGHKNNLKRLYKKRVFNQDNLDKLYKDIAQYRFVKQTKYPEILFTKDSTKVFVYVEKAQANNFDGFIGFSNDENKKVVFTGYLDLTLNNILNSGEKLALYWKSNGQDQKIFNLGVEIPYAFKSPIGLKAQLNIFKQDSTFQNTQTAIDFGYYFNYNTRLYLGYQSAESSDIKNLNTATLSDYKNKFYTSNFEFVNYKNDDFLFPEKSNFNIKIGTGKRDSKFQKNAQFFGSVNLKHNIYLNNKNVINIKSQNFYLQSDEYIINELYRFGGINSIRGFNENSLQGNIFSSILTEYRYVLSPSIYVHSIIDYAYFQDKTTKLNGNLLGLGFGFGILTKNGLLNLVYANGSTKDQAIKLSNSIVHISLKATF
ncbi:hypothetical protein OX283_007485 [Flavobacterium sp. SUN052]|uniref:hypothetical protein n=1 Tax=Flavobacterium sp. SUN052 TaxID=3002441 RepID=UPI00237D3EDD|nr:hypothetical protein [Flavobacterium sp. SUN052]MEC4004494.1 hypothetical protein [Flavobacterium sp. SUN052]